MRRTIPLHAAVSILLTALACNIPSFRGGNVSATPSLLSPPPPTPTLQQVTPSLPTSPETAEQPLPQATSTAPSIPARPPAGVLLYETTFQTGWPVLDMDNGNSSLVPEGYQINANQYALWVYTTRVRTDSFYAEAVATPTLCPTGQGAYGLLFHFQDDNHFRSLVVTCSGRYSLLDRTGPNSTTTLSEGTLPPDINPSIGEHVISVRAFGNALNLYMDYLPLDTIEDIAEMPTGDIGLYVQTIDSPISVIFSRLSVFAGE